MHQQIRSRRPIQAPTGVFPPNESAGLSAWKSFTSYRSILVVFLISGSRGQNTPRKHPNSAFRAEFALRPRSHPSRKSSSFIQSITNGTEIKVRFQIINELDRNRREISLIVRFHLSTPNSTNERPALDNSLTEK